jgi:hypothetical protein
VDATSKGLETFVFAIASFKGNDILRSYLKKSMETVIKFNDIEDKPDLQMIVDSLFHFEAWHAEKCWLMDELASTFPADDSMRNTNKLPVVGKNRVKLDDKFTVTLLDNSIRGNITLEFETACEIDENIGSSYNDVTRVDILLMITESLIHLVTIVAVDSSRSLKLFPMDPMFIPCRFTTYDPVVGAHSVETFPETFNNRMFLAEGQTVARLNMVATTVDDCLVEG